MLYLVYDHDKRDQRPLTGSGRQPEERKMTRSQELRAKITAVFSSAKTQIDADQIVARGGLKQIAAEFCDLGASEIMYEWDLAKNSIVKMTRCDD